jgi:hypothetical protein
MTIFERDAAESKKSIGTSLLRNMKNATGLSKPPLNKKPVP